MKNKLLVVFCSLLFCLASTFAGQDNSFKKIQDKNRFVVGLDATFAPMGFKDEYGQLVGFDVDLAREVAKRIKVELVLQPCVWDSIFFELKNGNIDAIWNGLTMNEERQANALFSKPYMTNSVVVVVNEKSSINKLADLRGKRVAVQAGAPAATYVQNYQGAGFNAKMLKELVQYPDNAMAFYDLKKGGVDVVAVDEIFADYYIKTQKLRLRRLPDFIAKEQIGIAFRKNDTTLRDKVQEALDSMIKDGTAARISMKWFGRDVFSTHN